MNMLLKKSDRIILFVGPFLGLVALSQPYLKAFIGSGSSPEDLRAVNGERMELDNVEVIIPELLEDKPKINLNTADRNRLAKLSGVGPVLAERIVTYRAENGNFASVQELDEVNGIGPSTIKRIFERVTVGEGTS